MTGQDWLAPRLDWAALGEISTTATPEYDVPIVWVDAQQVLVDSETHDKKKPAPSAWRLQGGRDHRTGDEP